VRALQSGCRTRRPIVGDCSRMKIFGASRSGPAVQTGSCFLPTWLLPATDFFSSSFPGINYRPNHASSARNISSASAYFLFFLRFTRASGLRVQAGSPFARRSSSGNFFSAYVKTVSCRLRDSFPISGLCSTLNPELALFEFPSSPSSLASRGESMRSD